MPAAFDLEDLIKLGEENKACPYYAAKSMASAAHIVFCPYNYLIEPTIRNSVSNTYIPLTLYPRRSSEASKIFLRDFLPKSLLSRTK
jgi:hypothetical protein